MPIFITDQLWKWGSTMKDDESISSPKSTFSIVLTRDFRQMLANVIRAQQWVAPRNRFCNSGVRHQAVSLVYGSFLYKHFVLQNVRTRELLRSGGMRAKKSSFITHASLTSFSKNRTHPLYYSRWNEDGETMVHSGWGRISGSGPLADVLQKAVMEFYADGRCENVMGLQILDQFLCVGPFSGGPGITACNVSLPL